MGERLFTEDAFILNINLYEILSNTLPLKLMYLSERLVISI
jgi:hypothetical protein